MKDNPKFFAATRNFATATGEFRAGMLYAVDPLIADEWIRKGFGYESNDRPQYVQELLARLDDGAGKPCLFAPPVGAEFGHIVLSHMRLVHFHRASEKVVCCRPGQGVLYPSVGRNDIIEHWTDPTLDKDRMGTSRDVSPEIVPEWADIRAAYPDHHVVTFSGFTLEQELWAIHPTRRIELFPRRRGLRADVVLGVRHRELATNRNWAHWQALAEAANAAGISFAVAAARDTSFDLPGQLMHTEGDTDAAVELLQHCKLYIGTDSGASHLASTVGAPMLIIGRDDSTGFRDFTHRMAMVNPNPIEIVREGWTKPQRVIERMLARMQEAA